MIEVDARGLSCPEPVMLAHEALKASAEAPVRVLVSTATARDNVRSLAKKRKRTVRVEEMGEDFALIIE